jgi:hypothetical protein
LLFRLGVQHIPAGDRWEVWYLCALPSVWRRKRSRSRRDRVCADSR